MAQYQDIILPNGIVKKGQRDCESRWEVIKKELRKRYDRPISVLDIGANFGYFSFRIQEEFPGSVVTLVESKHAKKLIELCEKTNANNTIVLDTLISSEELKQLASCEHFDVVLGLNVIHHIGDVKISFSAIENMADTIIIETPNPNDEGACGQKNLDIIYKKIIKEYDIIGEFTRHTSSVNSPMGIKDIKKTTLEKRYWDSKPYENKILIESSKDEKSFFHIEKNEKRDWIHGINLRTYQYLNGQYPKRNKIAESLKDLDFSNHEDLNPWNLILSGNNIFSIDKKDTRHTKPTNNKIQIEKIINDLLTPGVNSIKVYKK
jgi:2-polyprenyl-3-methyl-5-hydroxy-6-metoxy-1,4-benzoquinol methylase